MRQGGQYNCNPNSNTGPSSITNSNTNTGKGLCTKADNYVVEFPPSMLVGHKVALLGAALLIDYRYFEEPDDNNNNDFGATAQGDMTR